MKRVRKEKEVINMKRLTCYMLMLSGAFLFVILSNPMIAKSEDTIKIGILAPMSGPMAVGGKAMVDGAKVAINELNKHNGVLGKNFELEIANTQTRPPVGVKAFRELVLEKNVRFTLGCISSGVALAVSPIAKELGAIFLCAPNQTEKLSGTRCSRNTFRVYANIGMRARACAVVMNDWLPHIKKWAAFCPDYEYGHRTWEIFIEKLKSLNPDVTVVSEIFPPFMAGNFETYITKVIAAKPDGVFCTLYTTDMITMVKQAQRFGLFDKIKAFVNSGCCPHIDNMAMGPIVPETWGAVSFNEEYYKNLEARKFWSGYQALHKNEPDYAYDTSFAPETYAAVMAYAAAIKKAGSTDVDQVINALRGLRWMAPEGERYMRPDDHQAVRHVLVEHHIPTKESPYIKRIDQVEVPACRIMRSVEETGCRIR